LISLLTLTVDPDFAFTI